MIKEEFFLLIEQSGSTGITAKEISDHMGWRVETVRTWLSRWKTRGYLKLIPHEGHVYDPNRRWSGGRFTAGRPTGSCGRYVIGGKWWGELIYSREDIQ